MKIGKLLADPQSNSKRGLLLGLAGLSAVAWGWQRYVHRAADLGFTPIPGLTGWRQVETGAISGGSAADAVFLGIGADAITPLPAQNLCDTLYTTTGTGLPVAVFTDINCPNCRSLEAKLATRQDRLSLNWLQLPLLGPASVTAARVSIAASLLNGAPAPPPQGLRGTGLSALIRHHANRAGLDPEALSAEIESARVTTILNTHASTAETLGIWGTPALTIGKTLVMGDVSLDVLDQLLAMEHPACL